MLGRILYLIIFSILLGISLGYLFVYRDIVMDIRWAILIWGELAAGILCYIFIWGDVKQEPTKSRTRNIYRTTGRGDNAKTTHKNHKGTSSGTK